MLRRSAMSLILLSCGAATASAGLWHHHSKLPVVLPVPAVTYYAPVVDYPPDVTFYPPGVIAYTPGYYSGPGPIVLGKPGHVRSHIYYHHQPLRNTLKVIAP